METAVYNLSDCSLIVHYFFTSYLFLKITYSKSQLTFFDYKHFYLLFVLFLERCHNVIDRQVFMSLMRTKLSSFDFEIFFTGNPLQEETEKISSLWHSGLFNAHIDTQR